MATMLVVPTCRPKSLKGFFDAWEGKGGWDVVCVIEDAPKRSDVAMPPDTIHFAHEDVDKMLDVHSWIISRRDSAIRCFGFLEAWKRGMDVLTLDDDCLPVDGQKGTLVGAHVGQMLHPVWVPSVPGMRTRGMPYKNAGATRLSTMANVGLWCGVPDLDGPQSLLNPVTDFTPPRGNRIVPMGQFIPTCGMNLYIKHDALPLFYFPMMGEKPDGSPWPYRRFDDIAAGIIAKHCMDHLGWALSVGEPWVHHWRASDPFVNLIKEAPGIAWNENFWCVIKSIKLDSITACECMREVGESLAADAAEYHQHLGKAVLVWSRLMESK